MKLVATLDETDKKIIELLLQGHAPKEIAHKLWKSKASIHKRLLTLRRHHNCSTTIQLISVLGKEVA